jgi:leucyl-tRNA synthetase
MPTNANLKKLKSQEIELLEKFGININAKNLKMEIQKLIQNQKILKKLPNLLGHSLGGNFLIKYLSENNLQINNLYLVASCLDEGDFSTNLDLISSIEDKVQGKIYIYHSLDDKIVDFKQAEILKQKLPKAKLIKFTNRGHFTDFKFLEIKNQIIQDLIKNKKITDFEKFYPTQEMTTAKEIFYIWILRMIMLGKYWTGQVPFQKVIITPTILDDKGRKMSKSLGNGLDPVIAIQKYSADSLRLAMLSGMIPNRNMKMGGRIADELMQKYRNLGNKIWNIARFLESKEKGLDKFKHKKNLI